MRIARIRALTFLCALALVAALATLWAIKNDSQQAGGASCEPGAVEIKTSPIPDPEQIEIVVLNGTDRTGLAEQAANQLKDRGFQVIEVGDTDETFDGSALVKYGPDEYAAGLHTHAYFYQGRDGFDLEWDKPITVILGDAFKEVRSTSDARQSFAQSGGITAPDGTCPVE
ncbi:LytR C-terminal domain-containing protein [Glycomyces arizonensis]|uniref:LytR C-terminal domain-containing protein n=1 Tax=Glycomyces arizonensis TaxID=256035 RepID=UPI00146F97A8|nr:LytR C-terminal domain-containing protein [Glycomyces arizonensis]